MKHFLWLVIGICLTTYGLAATTNNTEVQKFSYQSPSADLHQKNVEVNLSREDKKITGIDIRILWTPGADVDVETSQISEDAQGIKFNFTDSFGNQGTGTLTKKDENLILGLTVTEMQDSRGARQLGEYTLKKSSP